jgi:hypothetical protein
VTLKLTPSNGILKELKVSSVSKKKKKSPHFMELEGSLTCSQEPPTGTQPELDELYPRPTFLYA